MDENILFWEVCLWYYPSQQGIAPSKLTTEYKIKVWKLFKIKNEDTITMSLALFYCIYC